LIYDNTPGRFYPYKEALKEGGKALLKISPFAVGGYLINNSLSNPFSWNPLTTVAKLGSSLVWNTIKTPLMYLGGLYVLYKTVKGFLKGHNKRLEAKKIASRAQLEDIASQINERRRYLEDNIIQTGGGVVASE